MFGQRSDKPASVDCECLLRAVVPGYHSTTTLGQWGNRCELDPGKVEAGLCPSESPLLAQLMNPHFSKDYPRTVAPSSQATPFVFRDPFSVFMIQERALRTMFHGTLVQPLISTGLARRSHRCSALWYSWSFSFRRGNLMEVDPTSFHLVLVPHFEARTDPPFRAVLLVVWRSTYVASGYNPRHNTELPRSNQQEPCAPRTLLTGNYRHTLGWIHIAEAPLG
ncbi:hypothetical protein B0T20DRAFT_398103 [Sordaria brevicollis]|uniref:Uncharacterized protein n=1 Tax=Sordaria brevicollis TaxID=83679 RepID=A0AAE0U225_SORBR|nr:hypothetical protein B0T20DRAFT_398103 [Sordaria brevicollis]